MKIDSKEQLLKCFYINNEEICIPTAIYNKFYNNHPDWFDWKIIKRNMDGMDINKYTIYCTEEAEKSIRRVFPNSDIKIISWN